MERGLFSLVMHMSRVWGVAPFKSGTYEISKPLVVYGFLIIFILTAHEIWYWFFTIAIAEGEKMVVLDYIRLTSYVSILLYLMVGGYAAAGRTARFIRFIKQLEQLFLFFSLIDLYIDKKITPSNIRYWDGYTMFVLAFYTAIRLMELTHALYFWFLFDDCMENKFDEQHQRHRTELYKITTNRFHTRILVTLKSINKHLHDITKDLSMASKDDNVIVYPKKPRAAWTTTKCVNYIKAKGDISASKKEAVESRIRRLSNYYADICRVFTSTINIEGLVIILIIWFQMMYLQLQSFKFIVSVTLGNWNYILWRSVVLSFIHISSLVLFIEPFHRIQVQMKNTSVLVQELKCICGERQALSNELHLFLRQLVLLKSTFSPLDICTLNRDLPFKILGALLSYLIIMVTYKPEFFLPSLARKSKWVFL